MASPKSTTATPSQLELGDLWLPITNIDRRRCKRVVPMEVFSFGMCRTGTSTIKRALQILGYNDVYHMANNLANARDADMWRAAFEAKYNGIGKFGREEWDQLLGHCMATTDGPCNKFAPELLAAYPEAKVILCERNVDSWYRSVLPIINGVYSLQSRILAFTDPFVMGRLRPVFIWNANADFNSTNVAEARANAKDAYHAHYALIRSLVPKERLLEYRLGDGWEPLCKFLGKEVPGPEVEFPHLNEGKSLKVFVHHYLGEAMKRSLFNVGCVVGVLSAVGYGVYIALDW